MSAVSLGIIGKGNEPLYLRDFSGATTVDDAALFGLTSDEDGGTTSSFSPTSTISLRQEFILHAALDRFVQVNGPPPGFAWRHNVTPTTTDDPQFVGLLGPWEDWLVYGWMTTTQIKFLVALQDNGEDTKQNAAGLLRQLHKLYVEYRLNPLGPLTGPIVSKRFDEKVRQTIEGYNNQQRMVW